MRHGHPFQSSTWAGLTRRVAAVATLALLVGCQGWNEDLRAIITAGSDVGETAEIPDRHPEEPIIPPPPAVTPKPRPDRAVAEIEKTASRDLNNPADPEHLIGMNEQQVEVTLGTPTAQRDVPPARIWHYSEVDCVISVYFYLNLDSQTFQALRYEIIQRPRSKIEGRECYAMREASQRQPVKREG